MADGKLEVPQKGNGTRDDEALRRLLDFVDHERKNNPPRRDGFDSFRGLDRFYGKRDDSQAFEAQAAEIYYLQARRDRLEDNLSPDKKDELRKARRDYATARTEDDKSKFRKQIEGLVPGSADLNKKIDAAVAGLDDLSTSRKRPDPFECMRCHPNQNESYYDPYQLQREGLKSHGVESFYKPRPRDQFEARWAQIALESPVVKVNEALKQLPPIKVSSDDPVKLVKMGLTMSGVELDYKSAQMIEKAVGNIKSIYKEGASHFVVDRDSPVELPLPQKQEVGGTGIFVKSLELGKLEFNLGEGKYPDIRDIKGLRVKLEVPAALSNIAQIDDHVEIKRIYLKRVDGTGDFQVNIEVTNPVPAPVRKTVNLFYSKMPPHATITTPLITLGPDGKPK